MRIRHAIGGGAVLVAVLVACNTPTIPLPPPSPLPEDVVVLQYELDPTKLVFQSDWEDRKKSSFPPFAVVTIFNAESGHGTIVTADADGGFVSDPVTGSEGDPFIIRYVDEEGSESDELCVFVSLDRQSEANICSGGQPADGGVSDS